jgi:hypothetical protein
MDSQMIRTLIGLIFFFSFPAWAKGTIGGMIEVRSYDSASQLYDLKYVKYPGQGPFYVSLEDLCNGTKALDLQKLRRAPSSIVGNQYKLDVDIPYVDDLPAKKTKK